MGYGAAVAKKALIEVGNGSVEAAIDKIVEITEIEKKKNKKSTVKWNCPLCTFLNSPEKDQC